jgi:hypothetical protein
MRSLIGTVLGAFCLIAPAAAETPVAIVEDVQGNVIGVESMDYVAPGKIIKLESGAKLVLGYLKSCLHETITGGIVLVGTEESSVQFGNVQRVKVPCDTGAVQLSDQEASQSAATTFRKYDRSGPPKKLPTLYGVLPLVEATTGGTLTIERIDQSGERYSVPLKGGQMVRGKFYDFAKAGKALTPGATYLATLGSRRFVFLVDSSATPSQNPIIGRLLRLE